MRNKSDLIKVEHFLGSSSSQQTRKTYQTLPFRTVEISNTGDSDFDGKAWELTPRRSHSLTVIPCCVLEAVFLFDANCYYIFWLQQKRIWLICFSVLKTQRQMWESRQCRYVLKTVMIQIMAIMFPLAHICGMVSHMTWWCTCAVPLQTLVGLLKHDVIPMSWETMTTLSDRCRDPAVSVKKKALQCVDELLAVSLERKHKSLFKNKLSISHFCLGETRMSSGAEGMAAGCGASSDWLWELSAGQSFGATGAGSAQPGQAVLSQLLHGHQSETSLGSDESALLRVPESQVG